MKRYLQLLSAGIILLLPLYYWRFVLFGLPSNIIEVAIVILLLLTVYWQVFIQKRNLSLPFGFWWAVVIMIGFIVGTLIAPDKRVALGILKGWIIIPIIFYFCLFQLFTKKDYSILCKALYISIIAVAIYGILQWLAVIPLLHYQNADPSIRAYLSQHRAIAFFESPNYLAMFLAPPSVLLFGYFNFKRWQDYLLLLLPVVAIFLTDSRGGIAALLIGWIFILLARKSLKLAVWGGIAASLVIFILLILSPHSGGTGGDQARIFIWEQAWQLIKSHPVWGIGPGQFNSFLNARLANNAYYTASVRQYALHPHNVFLAFWLYGGLLSLIAFIGLVISFGYILAKQVSGFVAYALTAALLAILVHGMVDTTYFKNDLSVHFWLIIALGAILLADKDEKNSD